MKKILALLCAVICALALLGCTQKIELSEYVIVIPENADISTKYASENLALLLEQKTGVAITVVTDAEPEREREILLGETSREFSKTEKSLSEREYTIICLRYALKGGIPLPQREVANVLKISRSYISRIEKHAIEKLRAKLRAEEFLL